MAGARRRGIGFVMSFAEWWEIWEPRFSDRRQGGAVMCRTADRGPYAVGNVRIDTHVNNLKEAQRERFKRDFVEAWSGNPETAEWLVDKWDRSKQMDGYLVDDEAADEEDFAA